MFNFFKKESKKEEIEVNEETPVVSINYFIGEDNVPMLDILLQDYSDKTIKALCNILDILAKDTAYLNTINMIKEGFLSDNEEDALIKILTHVASQDSAKLLTNSEKSDMYIKPSDVIT